VGVRGLDLEIGWMPLLLDGARNPRIRQGGSGYLDVSRAIPLLDVPSGNVDRSQGDVHPLAIHTTGSTPRTAVVSLDCSSRNSRSSIRRVPPSTTATRKNFEARLNTTERT